MTIVDPTIAVRMVDVLSTAAMVIGVSVSFYAQFISKRDWQPILVVNFFIAGVSTFFLGRALTAPDKGSVLFGWSLFDIVLICFFASTFVMSPFVLYGVYRRGKDMCPSVTDKEERMEALGKSEDDEG